MTARMARADGQFTLGHMRTPLDAGVTDKSGPTLVFIIFTDRSVSTDTSRLSSKNTDIDRPEWPENDASFDYSVPGTSGAPS